MGQLMHSWVLSLFLPRCWCALRPTITFEVVAGPRVTFIAGHPRVLHLLWSGAQSPSGRPTSLLGIYNFLPLLHVGVFRVLSLFQYVCVGMLVTSYNYSVGMMLLGMGYEFGMGSWYLVSWGA
jgi:hypothetical protein